MIFQWSFHEGPNFYDGDVTVWQFERLFRNWKPVSRATQTSSATALGASEDGADLTPAGTVNSLRIRLFVGSPGAHVVLARKITQLENYDFLNKLRSSSSSNDQNYENCQIIGAQICKLNNDFFLQ